MNPRIPRGFTLYELMIAIVLAGTIIAFAFGMLLNQGKVAREAALSAYDLRNATRFCDAFRADARRAIQTTVKDASVTFTISNSESIGYASDENGLLTRTSSQGSTDVGPRVIAISFAMDEENEKGGLLRARWLVGALLDGGRLIVLDTKLESMERTQP